MQTLLVAMATKIDLLVAGSHHSREFLLQNSWCGKICTFFFRIELSCFSSYCIMFSLKLIEYFPPRLPIHIEKSAIFYFVCKQYLCWLASMWFPSDVMLFKLDCLIREFDFYQLWLTDRYSNWCFEQSVWLRDFFGNLCAHKYKNLVCQTLLMHLCKLLLMRGLLWVTVSWWTAWGPDAAHLLLSWQIALFSLYEPGGIVGVQGDYNWLLVKSNSVQRLCFVLWT